MPRTPTKPATRRPGILLLGILLPLAASLATGCSTYRPRAPQLAIDNPGEHRLFVDGRELATDEPLKFRYYGVTRWDLLPRVQVENGLPAFDHLPASGAVAITAPASPWLFPLDFPLEVVDRLLHGRRDQRVTARATARENGPGGTTISRQELSRLSARARAARARR